MYPEQNQVPIDYLNQIAPEPKKPGMSNRLFLAIVGVGAALALIVGLMTVLGGFGSTANLETLAARLQTLQKIANDSQRKIKSGALRSTNSNLSLFLTNTIRDIAVPLKNNGVDITKLNKTIVAQENGQAVSAKLEDARLNAVFDRTYAREMSYQLATLTALMKTIFASNKSKSLQEFLLTTDKSLQPIKQQLADFNATKS